MPVKVFLEVGHIEWLSNSGAIVNCVTEERPEASVNVKIVRLRLLASRLIVLMLDRQIFIRDEVSVGYDDVGEERRRRQRSARWTPARCAIAIVKECWTRGLVEILIDLQQPSGLPWIALPFELVRLLLGEAPFIVITDLHPLLPTSDGFLILWILCFIKFVIACLYIPPTHANTSERSDRLASLVLRHTYRVFSIASASEKCSSTTFIEVDTSNRMAPLRMLYIVTLTYFFKVKTFLEIYKYKLSGKRWELAKDVQVRLL